MPFLKQIESRHFSCIPRHDKRLFFLSVVTNSITIHCASDAIAILRGAES